MAIAQRLDERGIPYALGGALAYGIWAVARGTMDVVLNLFVDAAELGPSLDALESAGVLLDRATAEDEARNGGQIIGWLGACRIDVFTPSIDFSWEALRTRVRADVLGRQAWFLSAEALAVFKLLFFRPKDIVDLERVLATQGTRIDAPYVRRWIVEIMGDDDVRVTEWDRLVAAFWK
jgi:hypothetical protein